MIVSHKHKLIFLKPRKVAGTSFEMAFSGVAGADDIITPLGREEECERQALGHVTCQHFRYGWGEIPLRLGTRAFIKAVVEREPPVKFYNHIPAKDCRDRIGSRIWNEYHKVSIVRNPWDVIVSWYYFDQRNHAADVDLQEWCLRCITVLGLNKGQYLIDGDEVVDRFLRYEHLREDIAGLEAAFPRLSGLHDRFASIGSKSGIRPEDARDLKRVFRDRPQLSAMIAAISHFEVSRFGYAAP